MKSTYLYILLGLILLTSGCTSRKNISGKNKKGEKTLSQKKENEFSANLIEATTQKIIGNYELAEELYEKGLKIIPKSAVTYFELSGIYDYKKEYRKALESAEKSVNFNPENDWYKTNLAVLYQKYGMYEKSLNLYNELVEKHPNRYEYLFTLAENYLILGKKEKALEVYDKIQDRIGNTEELALHKENLYLELGQFDKAVEEIERLIEESPNNPGYYGVLAELYHQTGEDEKAIALYQKVKEIDPDNPNVDFSLFNFYKEKGEDEKAYEALKAGFSNPNASVDTKVRILLAYLKTKNKEDREKGEELAKLLVKAHPNDARSYTAIAEFYYQKERNKEALEAYKKALQFDKDQFLIWEQVVFLEADMQLFDSLEIDSEKAIELFPSQPLFYFFSGLSKLHNGKVDEAIERLLQGKDLIIDNPKLEVEFYEKLGDAYHLKKEHDLSDEYYEKALELNLNNANLLNNYSYYLAQRKEKLEKAEQLAKKAVQLNSQNSNYLDTYGWVLFQEKKYPEALDVLEEALQYGGNNSSTILEHFGDVNYFLNNNSTAVEYWEKALKLKPDSKLLKEKIKAKKYIENLNEE